MFIHMNNYFHMIRSCYDYVLTMKLLINATSLDRDKDWRISTIRIKFVTNSI